MSVLMAVPRDSTIIQENYLPWHVCGWTFFTLEANEFLKKVLCRVVTNTKRLPSFECGVIGRRCRSSANPHTEMLSRRLKFLILRIVR